VKLLIFTALMLIALAPPAEAAIKPTFSITGASVAEGAIAKVAVTKNAKASSYSKITVTTVDGTAKANVDYKPVNTSITVGNNTLTVAIPVSTIARAGYQGNRSFTVHLVVTRNGVVGNSSNALVTVLETEQPLPPPPPPPAVCPDGTTVPAGHTCPIVLPPPPPTASACKPLNMSASDPNPPSANMLCTATKTCHDYQFGTPAWQNGDPVVEAGKQYYVVRGALWGIGDDHVVAWVPRPPGTPTYEVIGFPGWTLGPGGAYFNRSCFE
jgi:hypothetical protein